MRYPHKIGQRSLQLFSRQIAYIIELVFNSQRWRKELEKNREKVLSGGEKKEKEKDKEKKEKEKDKDKKEVTS